MNNIKELKIWHVSVEMALTIYQITADFPKEETYGLVSQMRRCAVSIPSNIAEGSGRNTKGEFIQFLGIANGSAFELQTQVILAAKLGFIRREIELEVLDKIDHIQKMNYNFQRIIKGK